MKFDVQIPRVRFTVEQLRAMARIIFNAPGWSMPEWAASAARRSRLCATTVAGRNCKTVELSSAAIEFFYTAINISR
jgi:hypothetical protein